MRWSRQPGWHHEWVTFAELRSVDAASEALAAESYLADRPLTRADRAEFRNRDREVRQELEQERLELIVGAVDLVDQEDDRIV